MQVEVDMKCMQTNFGGHGYSGFQSYGSFCLPSKMVKIHGLYFMGVKKSHQQATEHHHFYNDRKLVLGNHKKNELPMRTV